MTSPDGRVRVLLLCGTARLEEQLGAMLGDTLVPLPVRRTHQVAEALKHLAPALIVVDADDPVDQPARVAAILDVVSRKVTSVVWAADGAWGRGLARSLDTESFGRVNMLSRRDGIAPLLDLVRSRRRVAEVSRG